MAEKQFKKVMQDFDSLMTNETQNDQSMHAY